MSEDEGEPEGKEGAGFEVEGVEDVRDHEANDEGGDDGGAAEVEEEGGGGDKGEGDPVVVDESGGVFEGSGRGGREVVGGGVAMASSM